MLHTMYDTTCIVVHRHPESNHAPRASSRLGPPALPAAAFQVFVSLPQSSPQLRDMFVYSVLPIVLLAAAGVSAATAPLDIVSSLILALPVSPLCTVSSACSALSTLAPACFDPSLAGNAQGQAQCACTVGFTNAMGEYMKRKFFCVSDD